MKLQTELDFNMRCIKRFNAFLTLMLSASFSQVQGFTLSRRSSMLSKPMLQKRNMVPIDSDPIDFDDEDFFDDEDSQMFAQVTEKQQIQSRDLSGCSKRQFNLGYDLILTDFSGSLGFEEVTDWEYYQPSLLNNERKIVEPPPFDPNLPKRTREKSGSVVRIFRGELSGRLASSARARGLDIRVMVKEFQGETAAILARTELESLSRLQSNICSELDDGARKGGWLSSASTRYLNGRLDGSTKEDDENLIKWIDILNKKQVPYVGVHGELNLVEFFENENNRNDWYRALGVAPPKPKSILLVYEYCGLTTLSVYCQPALKRWFNLPIQNTRGFLGRRIPPPPLPQWRDRARYVKHIMKQCLEGLRDIHDAGFTHRSLGRSSIILSSVGQDKMEASSPFATVPGRLRVKLADFGFSGRFVDASNDEDFRRRARAFNINIREGGSQLEAKYFAMSEDFHSLGFVFIALLLSSLAEIPKPDYVVPPTDEDALQRLMADIFEKDMVQFRDYCSEEEIWSSVVSLLDEDDKAGWGILQLMCFAREGVKENIRTGKILTVDGLLSSPFFNIK
jgi:serine/threonine protein kinase